MTSAAFATEETYSQYSVYGTLQISPVFTPYVFMFTDARCLSPSPLPPITTSTRTYDSYWQTAQDSAAAQVKESSLDTCS